MSKPLKKELSPKKEVEQNILIAEACIRRALYVQQNIEPMRAHILGQIVSLNLDLTGLEHEFNRTGEVIELERRRVVQFRHKLRGMKLKSGKGYTISRVKGESAIERRGRLLQEIAQLDLAIDGQGSDFDE